MAKTEDNYNSYLIFKENLHIHIYMNIHIVLYNMIISNVVFLYFQVCIGAFADRVIYL